MNELSRRAFLQRLGYLAGAGVVTPMAINLSAMNKATAATTDSDYKALVCVLLDGGNDQANTLIPIDTSNYATYRKIRQDIALDQSTLLPLIPATNLAGGLKWGFNPNLKRLNSLFHLRKLAVLQNVGSLVQPTSLDQYKNRSVALPRGLFSHFTQKQNWQSTASDSFREGWGGKIGDAILKQNSHGAFSCVGTDNDTLFLTGENTNPLKVTPYGIKGTGSNKEGSQGSDAMSFSEALSNLFTSSDDNAVTDSTNESMMLSAIEDAKTISTEFATENALAQQLKTVASLIKARDTLGVKRQIFFVKLKGFDTHNDLLGRHSTLMRLLDDALGSFYEATEELGVSQNVTTFTMSEFGRTFNSHGDGSEHGWGGHHFIMGGAVKGRDFYGEAPEIGLDTAIDVGEGAWLPTTSIDQYSATLAKWFGVSDNNLTMVAPNLHKFNNWDLGFMSS
ncbi:DUF1501 domain-containing protein [Psychrobacter sp. P11G5]|uniref:DUF1501 domain-containing protein n=1 Tax=Psychrobacter sp. P11G5 TaxID=1699624 RepID=UPI00078E9313|nr:DUF1501 domain-containing protein [Psychrobacter sp. P11G5]AMN66859.1 hypothetical protein AK825_03265 [Psychrobacter sp. P11G5]